MKINQFIEEYKKSNGMKSVKVLAGTKNYLPFVEKQALAKKVLNRCMRNNNGYIQFDEVEKYIIFTIEIIMAYTNLEFDKNIDVAVCEYDSLCESGVLNNIIETFEGEYKTVLDMVGMRQDYILQSNSVEAQVAQFLNGLNEKLDMLVGNISEQFDSFGFNNLDINANDIAELTQFIKTLGK